MPVYDTSPTPNAYQPSDIGLIAWQADPAQCNNASLMTVQGFLYVQRLKLKSPARITNIHCIVNSAGVALNVGQCFAGLFNSAGSLVGSTADQATNWQSTGALSMALVGGPYDLPAGDIYTAMYANHTAGTFPGFRTVGSPTSTININVIRFASANSGLTTAMPATLGALTASSNNFWTAVS